MANCDFPSITQSTEYNNNTDETDTIYQANGVTSDALLFTETLLSQAGQEFGYSLERTDLSNKTAKEKTEIMTEALMEHPEGLIVRVNGHTLVFVSSTYTLTKAANFADIKTVKLTPEIEKEYYFKESLKTFSKDVVHKSAASTGYEQYFRVYDPGTSQSEKGDNVTFNNSWSYIDNNSNINSITHFDVISF